MTKEIKLPKPKNKSTLSLEEALNKRRSIRDYKKGSLSIDQVSQLLWAASGVNQYGRTFPSAGATYPLETYLVAGDVEGLEQGIYHYLPNPHSLEKTKDGDVRKALSQAALGQGMIEDAPVNIIIAVEYFRTTSHYGERGKRYVHMEAGHVGQNIHLQAEVLNLGTVMVGAFRDERVKGVLGIKEDPLYIIPIGKI
ncbi:MAG: nitroreductase [Bacteroides sp. SM1_62]|nr:MAG: nitroreductase [Bacteroides sp. SM1_62]